MLPTPHSLTDARQREAGGQISPVPLTTVSRVAGGSISTTSVLTVISYPASHSQKVLVGFPRHTRGSTVSRRDTGLLL